MFSSLRLPTLAICKQCRTRLGDQEEQDEVVFAVPVSENEAQEVEDSTQHTGTTSSRAENIALVRCWIFFVKHSIYIVCMNSVTRTQKLTNSTKQLEIKRVNAFKCSLLI